MQVQKLGRSLFIRSASYNWVSRTCIGASRARRWNSTAAAAAEQPAPDGPAATETNRAEATKTRFWNDVGIEKRGKNYAVTLDKRALKTPSGNTLLIPENKSLLASLIAAEWDHQDTLLKPHALPITSITARAIDSFVEEQARVDVQSALLKYLDTDTICFYQDYPPQLERLQSEHWDPLLAWAKKNFDVTIKKNDSILSHPQPEENKEKLAKVIAKFDQWELAALERATYATKSFIIGLALVTKHLNVEQASKAATVEVSSQIERWGEVEDTHDVDYQDIRRQLGSAALLLSNV